MKIIIAFLVLRSLSAIGADIDAFVLGTFSASKSTNGSEKKFVELKIKRKDSHFELTGSAGYSSGRSAAPDFSGISKSSEKQPIQFFFTDSFGNEGIAYISPTKSGILFSAKITKLEDERCLPFYDSMKLTRK